MKRASCKEKNIAKRPPHNKKVAIDPLYSAIFSRGGGGASAYSCPIRAPMFYILFLYPTSGALHLILYSSRWILYPAIITVQHAALHRRTITRRAITRHASVDGRLRPSLLAVLNTLHSLQLHSVFFIISLSCVVYCICCMDNEIMLQYN